MKRQPRRAVTAGLCLCARVACAESAREIREVTVQGQREQRAAEAVNVVSTRDAHGRTADLGELLARTEGVSLRRTGGFGSEARLWLNGLGDERVRVFLDGVPLELAGYTFGVANVPLNLVGSLEIYRGVLPLRLAGDALGGAIDLVSAGNARETGATASYQFGAFGTARSSALANYHAEKSGLFTRFDAFFDRGNNDYPIRARVPDALGRETERTVLHFHDAYRGYGAHAEVGVLDRSFADQLSLGAFFTDHRHEVQNNLMGSVPYGEPLYRRPAWGTLARYRKARGAASLAVNAGYTYQSVTFRDVSPCNYLWSGHCTLTPTPGEISAIPVDQAVSLFTTYASLYGEWRLTPTQQLRFLVKPRHQLQEGKNSALPEGFYDILQIPRKLITSIQGIEHAWDVSEALSTITSLKAYAQRLVTRERLPSARLRELTLDRFDLGVAEALRLRLSSVLSVKASYEYATRMPMVSELFGDGELIVENLRLAPERSHNSNLELDGTAASVRFGELRASLSGFGRVGKNLITLLNAPGFARYENVETAAIWGVAAKLVYTAPREFLSLDVNGTYQDARNRSETRPLARFRGDRLPNQPYLFANAALRARYAPGWLGRDALTLDWHTRYVHTFFSGWESAGRSSDKLTVPTQLLHALGLTYQTESPFRFSYACEVQNVSDRRNYDSYGVELPGRALYFKVTGEV